MIARHPARSWAALVIAALLLLAAPAVASATTRTVCASGCDFTTIQAAVTASSTADTVQVGAGNYTGNVTVNKAITIDGAGADVTKLTASTAFNVVPAGSGATISDLAIDATSATGTTYGVTATGGAVDDVTLSGLKINRARYAIDVRNTATADGWSIEDVVATGNNFGARFWGDTTNLSIDASQFDRNDYGLYTQYKSRSGTIGVPGVFDGVTVTDSTFSENSTKGLYLEAVSNAFFAGVEVDGTGTIAQVRPAGDPPYPVTGIDVNVKYGTFSDVRFLGVGVRDTVGTAWALKGRNDAPSYSDVPATLDEITLENVTAADSTATANPEAAGTGIAFGYNVTNATVDGSRIVANQGGGLLSYVTSGDPIVATDNWWGCNAGPGQTGCDGVTVQPGAAAVDADPWQVLSIESDASTLNLGQTAGINANFNTNSDGESTIGMADGTPVHFATNLGSVDPTDVDGCGCGADTTLSTGNVTGKATVQATVDNQSVSTDVRFVRAGTLQTSPASIDFGAVGVGDSSSPQAVTVSNPGDVPVGISQVRISGAGGSQVHVDADDCTSTTLDAGDSCELELTFAPASAGSWTPTLVIEGTGATKQVPLSGQGVAPALQISPDSYDFGDVLANGSAQHDVTVTNTGGGQIAINNMRLNGTGGTLFTLSGNTCAGASLGAGQSCTFTVTFAPRAAGSWTPKLVLETSGPTAYLPLAGRGIAADMSLSTPSLSFGNVLRRTTSSAQTVTVTNSGTAPLLVNGIRPNGTGGTLFTVSNDLCTGHSVGAGSTCTFDVTFAPRVVGVWTPQLVITANAATQYLALLGTGI